MNIKHLIFIAALMGGVAYSMPATAGENLFKAAFGSCNKAELPQPMWQVITSQNPDVFIWTGDNVYAEERNMDHLKEMYSRQRAQPGYVKLSGVADILGTWDDHDYGLDDGGKYFEFKEQSRKLFMDFLDVPDDDPRRGRKGVYFSRTYGMEGRQVKFIILDTRFNRDDPGPEADILGNEQWQWLEAELKGSSAGVHLIVSSIQVLASEHRYEKWANFPAAKKKLFDTIRSSGARGVVFISGDRHFAEISRCESCLDYPVYDITSSGLTHSWSTLDEEANSLRSGTLYNLLNFGLVAVNWNVDPQEITLQIFGEDGKVHLVEKLTPGGRLN